MGRPPCCDKASVKKGPWTPEEDAKLLAYTSSHGTGNWTSVPQRAGLKRCGKSCRLRYTNYLRPNLNLKHEMLGSFTQEEEDLIVTHHAMLGSRWSLIANQLPGRTNNDVRNYWNTKLSKKLRQRGIDPTTHRPIADLMQSIGTLAIRPPPATYLPANPAELPLPLHDVPYYAGPQRQQVVTHVDVDVDAPPAASPEHHHQPQLNWSDFLADDTAAAALEPPQVLGGGQYQPDAGAGGGEDDGAGPAFIDAILDCGRETGVDQLIAELLSDPAYYHGASSSSSPEMGWGC